ncbi:choline dehydrogenase [Chitinivorax sp. PXF-14]|uniref:GMC family oxidoreductase n=1 Tax=Chitinivorax sp. PXF-14 TaxID=3230488 RepID=UPI0034673C3B
MYDYVVVGGGSAGCVVAARLSEDPAVRVCLLEAGPDDTSPLVHVPVGALATVPRKLFNWAYESVPQPGLKGRRGYQPRGKVLGGSSCINAMIYIRGHRWDYDHWASLGNPGWSYDEVLPYFLKAEHNERGADAWHATGGPLNVTDLRSPSPVGGLFIEAAKQSGYAYTPDFNGASQEGVGPYQVTQVGGERCSAAQAYLRPIRNRPNLNIITDAHATRVIFEGKRAVGVEYRRGGRVSVAKASREVVLSGGAFGSPQLLMLSGIGRAEHLSGLGIPVVHDLPGVGQNLQEHPDYIMLYKSPSKDVLGITPSGVMHAMREWRRYQKERTGMFTSNFAEAGGFIKSDPHLAIPDLQWHFVIGMVEDHARKVRFGYGYSCHVCILRPKSRGEVTLASRDPYANPLIDMGYYRDESDLDAMVKAFKITRKVMEAPALAPVRGEEQVTKHLRSDDEIRDIIRSRGDGIYHPVGTCKMGNDPMAVVDAELRVHGIEGLRVVDASIMPTLIGGNTNAPAIMIGEKAADMIKQAATTPSFLNVANPATRRETSEATA